MKFKLNKKSSRNSSTEISQLMAISRVIYSTK